MNLLFSQVYLGILLIKIISNFKFIKNHQTMFSGVTSLHKKESHGVMTVIIHRYAFLLISIVSAIALAVRSSSKLQRAL